MTGLVCRFTASSWCNPSLQCKGARGASELLDTRGPCRSVGSNLPDANPWMFDCSCTPASTTDNSSNDSGFSKDQPCIVGGMKGDVRAARRPACRPVLLARVAYTPLAVLRNSKAGHKCIRDAVRSAGQMRKLRRGRDSAEHRIHSRRFIAGKPVPAKLSPTTYAATHHSSEHQRRATAPHSHSAACSIPNRGWHPSNSSNLDSVVRSLGKSWMACVGHWR